jgi:hypothetical protein
LEDFEELLVNYFYRQALLNFDINSCYTNWLIRNFRKIRKTEIEVYSLNTTYLTKKFLDNFEKEEFVYRVFQLLKYLEQFEDFVTIRDDQGKIETLNIRGEIFRYIMFPVSHFVEFTGISKTNKYQSKKIRDFLNSLQELPPLVDYFSDGGFRSILAFPYLRLIRKECWYVEFAIADKLRLYRYPFQFPKAFLTYQNKYDLRVKLFFLKSFSVMELEKELPVQKFLRQFAIPNAKKHQLRKLILVLLEEAQNSKLIQSEFTLLTRTKKIKNNITKNPGYPYSYGDELTPKMASNNLKGAVSSSVLISTILLGLFKSRESPRIDPLLLNNPKNEINKVVKNSDSNYPYINRGGDLGKPGPGPRAKADALKNARKTGGSSLFAEGFTPPRQYASD